MYLLIGHPADRCCTLVDAALRAAGHVTLTTPNPLAGDAWFAWMLTTEDSRSAIRWQDRANVTHDSLRGVFVRTPGGPSTLEGWAARDMAYVQAETNAALVAWLRSLDCPVVNPPDADLWFRPQRPLAELHSLFDRCGLPSLDTLITNDLQSARHFAEHWSGHAVYMPLTSMTHYPIIDDSHWAELANVIERVPVCLIEPTAGPSLWATVVGTAAIWNDQSNLSSADVDRFDNGLRNLARLLGAAFLQVEVRFSTNGPRCAGIAAYPQIELYTPDAQVTIADGIARLLMT